MWLRISCMSPNSSVTGVRFPAWLGIFLFPAKTATYSLGHHAISPRKTAGALLYVVQNEWRIPHNSPYALIA